MLLDFLTNISSFSCIPSISKAAFLRYHAHIDMFPSPSSLCMPKQRPGFSIYTLSLGKHIPLSVRLRAAANAGFKHIELDVQDWYDYLDQYRKHCNGAHTACCPCAPIQVAAAKALSSEIRDLGLQVLCLQPLKHFEGLLDEKARDDKMDEARMLLHVMPHLGTNLLLVPSNFLPDQYVTDDVNRMVEDLRCLAEMASSTSSGLRVAYEALAWGTRVDTWETAWDIVQKVDRENFGLALDSFNILGRIYADPTRERGLCVDAESACRTSLDRLVGSVPKDQIFLLQLADGMRPECPGNYIGYTERPSWSPGADVPMPPRMKWSRTSRLFPGELERGAFLPLVEFTTEVIGHLGFDGVWSLEYFNEDLERMDESVASKLAERGIQGLYWLWDNYITAEKDESRVSEKYVIDPENCQNM